MGLASDRGQDGVEPVDTVVVVGTYRLGLVVGCSQDGRVVVVGQVVLVVLFDQGIQVAMVVGADNRLVADSQAVRLEMDIQRAVVEPENQVVVDFAEFVDVVDILAVAVVVSSLALEACPAVVAMFLLKMQAASQDDQATSFVAVVGLVVQAAATWVVVEFDPVVAAFVVRRVVDTVACH